MNDLFEVVKTEYLFADGCKLVGRSMSWEGENFLKK